MQAMLRPWLMPLESIQGPAALDPAQHSTCCAGTASNRSITQSQRTADTLIYTGSELAYSKGGATEAVQQSLAPGETPTTQPTTHNGGDRAYK